jgi:ferredoxin
MKFIAMDDIGGLLEELSASAEVLAPRELRGSGGTVMFERWQRGDPVDTARFSATSAKDAVLPRTEPLFGFNYSFGAAIAAAAAKTAAAAEDAAGESNQETAAAGGKIEISPAPEPPATVLFGARACDARAVTVLDALFDQPAGAAYQDPGYRARRAGLTVVTFACVTCDDACFCSSFGEGPADKRGSDVMLYPVEGGFLAEAVTEKGERVVGSALFKDSGLEPPPLAVTRIVEGLAGLQQSLPAIFADLGFWEEATARCISCGFCTHACPTCHCFNIHDEMRGDREGERLRSWDACMFHLYTQETSGHNPRPTLAHRYRNRINHKFSYYPENQGEMLCTGCGRCIRGCPAGLDIRDVLRAAVARAGGGPGRTSQATAPEDGSGTP